MASLGELLSGALGGEYSMGRPLDEEERRLIEELRAQGAYVPQERKVSPFRYGAGTVSQQNLADVRGAIQPEQKRKMNELMWQRGQAARMDAAKEARKVRRRGAVSGQKTSDKISAMGEPERARRAMEQYNLNAAQRARMLAEQDRVGTGRVAEINALEAKQNHAIKGTGDPNDPWVRADKDRLDYLKQQRLPIGIQEESYKQQQQATATGERAAPTHAVQQEREQATAKLGTAVAKQELEVAEALNASQVNGQAYTTILAELKSGSAELARQLNQTKLDVQNSSYGKELMAKVASGQLQKADATLEQELLSITAFKQWLMSPDGLNFQSRGGTLGVDIDLKLAQIEALLERAKAETARAKSYGGGGSNLRGALTDPGGSSGYVGPAPFGTDPAPLNLRYP